MIIFIIRCTYNQEVAKISKSKSTGTANVYVPKLMWFAYADSFLKKNNDDEREPEINLVSFKNISYYNTNDLYFIYYNNNTYFKKIYFLLDYSILLTLSTFFDNLIVPKCHRKIRILLWTTQRQIFVYFLSTNIEIWFYAVPTFLIQLLSIQADFIKLFLSSSVNECGCLRTKKKKNNL